MTSVISMKALLESGVHFGHRTNKWHPAMRPYIFTEPGGSILLIYSRPQKVSTRFIRWCGTPYNPEKRSFCRDKTSGTGDHPR